MPASTAVTMPFYVFGRSTSKNQDQGVTKAVTAGSRGHVAGCRAAGSFRALMQYVTGRAAGTFLQKRFLLCQFAFLYLQNTRRAVLGKFIVRTINSPGTFLACPRDCGH